ncbi:pilus (MSHA type) biogenesis protein MshL [Parashewanella curva]|uniref:Pilus (MSHA type) biogenesis protein MshL n=1 Tax=Parashewanella curva TaxID=2338552 RepID=A0A3L8PW66_9GAMM|nr:pilus (MSHA type) biogenesis protein MshL [Parashewanella curva]RLV59049.1 pilus (MSHA type) biogenesis protein MshL [Parashewanella curva]
MKANAYLITLMSLVLVACQTTQRPQPVTAKSELNQAIAGQKKKTKPLSPPPALPNEVEQELSNNQTFGSNQLVSQERRFDVNASDVDARLFFASLVQNTPLSVVVHPQVTGKISLSLKAVTLSEVLQVVQDIYGYEISREGRILRVYPAGLRTETFPVNYLFMKRQGLSLTSVSSGRISDNNGNGNSNNNNRNNNGSNNANRSNNNGNNNANGGNANGNGNGNGTFIQSSNETDFWKDLEKTLSVMIHSGVDGRQVVVTPQAGLVTVRAYPDELRQVRTFLSTAENHLQRQVILEAKIIEVTLSDGYQQGIQWSNFIDKMGTNGRSETTFTTSTGQGLGDTISRTLGGIGSLNFVFRDNKNNRFSSIIQLLKTQGDVDVLSSPRVTASNNQKAVIKVGNDEYFVTNVSSNVVQNGTNNQVVQPNVELTPFFSGIALDVTPQIDDDGGVQLHVHPSVVDINEQTKNIAAGSQTLVLPLAQSEIRESDTVIKAKSGDVVVIGGLMKTEKRDQVSKVPLLGDIPFLGEAFTNRSKVTQKTELIILLKPTVVDESTWKTELERSKKLLDRWYPEN